MLRRAACLAGLMLLSVREEGGYRAARGWGIGQFAFSAECELPKCEPAGRSPSQPQR
jgi:hypothetical protein